MKSNITKVDVIILAILMLVYSVIALVNLGDMAAPETFWENTPGSYVTIDLGEKTEIEKVNVYNGIQESDDKRYTIIPLGEEGFEKTSSFTLESIFCWESIDIQTATNQIMLMVGGEGEEYIGEIAVCGPAGNLIEIKSVTDHNGKTVPELFDEQDLAVYTPSFKNGTYFDEIYHARTAYEYTHGIEAYEWTHPPLGKLIISIGIGIFGVNPFGWRIMGTLIGIMMLPIMYVMAKMLFKKTGYAAFACVLLSFDFMHFTQTRIATIDVYATFFIMLMYLFMYKFYEENYNETGLKKPFKYLALTGLCFGLGAASKWTCIYAGIGLAIIFAVYMVKRFMEYRRGKAENYVKNTVKILLWCVLFFVILPVGIYILSYLPYAFLETNGFTLENIWRIQKNTFDYHSNLEATHDFSSQWYSWPVIAKPIWYHITRLPEGRVMSISAFGNPAIWWVGIPASIAALIFAVRENKENRYLPVLLLVGYAAQYLPWAFIGRVIFIYHYFPSVPFVILLITYTLKKIYERAKNKKTVTIGAGVYVAVVIALFVMFYPAISGMETDESYIRNVLTWFDGWYIGG